MAIETKSRFLNLDRQDKLFKSVKIETLDQDTNKTNPDPQLYLQLNGIMDDVINWLMQTLHHLASTPNWTVVDKK
jgi:hypothetical protein